MINQIVKVKEILSHQSGINNRVIYSHEKKRGFVKPYPTKKYKAYQKEILSQFKGEIDIEENEAVKIELLFSFKKPKSWSKKVREETKYHLTKIDVDNMAKGVMDLMAEFYNFNDKQVVELKVNKEYNEEDYNYIAIKLEKVEEETTDYYLSELDKIITVNENGEVIETRDVERWNNE